MCVVERERERERDVVDQVIFPREMGIVGIRVRGGREEG